MKKKMPKRPIQHQDEDQSILAFEKLLPKEWVYRGKDKDDYGIDGEIEIFLEDGSATGQIFYVQLKSTSKNLNSKGELTYYLKNSTLNYYSEIEIPILLAVYFKNDDIFYARWVNNISTTINSKKEQYPIKFGGQDIVSTDFFKRLAEKDKINYVLQSVSVLIKTDDTSESNQLKEVLKSWFEIIFLQTIEINNLDCEQKIVLSITKNSNYLEVDIQDLFYGTSAKEKLLFNNSSSYLWYSNFSLGHINSEFKSLFLTITLSVLPLFGNIHNEFLARLLIFLNDDEEVSKIIPILLLLIASQEYRYIKNILEAWIKDSKYNLVQYFSLSILKIDSRLGKWHELHKLHESIILTAIKNVEMKELKGSLYYNLANATRYTNSKKSLRYYKLARQNRADYRNSEYWNKEVAGTLFVLRRYYCALKYYEIGLSLGDKENNKDYYILAFDSAFMARNFKLAKKYLTLAESCYLEEDLIPSEFILKATVLEWLDEEGYINSDFVYQHREAEEIVKYIDEVQVLEEDIFKSGIKFDPLHPLLNFNLGMKRNKEKDKMAYMHFLITALHEYHDFEAWGYTIVVSISSIESHELEEKSDSCNTIAIIPIIIDMYSTKYGHEGLQEFKSFLDSNNLIIDSELKKILFKMLSMALTESKSRERENHEDKIIRFLGS